MNSSPDCPVSAESSIVVVNDLQVLKDYESVLAANGLNTLDALFQVRGTEVLSKPGLDSWRERLRLTLVDGGQLRQFYLKRFSKPPGGARREVRRAGLGARSVAGAEWFASRALSQAGVPGVKAVAFGEEHRGNREVRSAVVTAAVPGKSLESWVRQWSTGDRAMIRGLLRPLARLVSDLHVCGFVHRDFYLSHVFFDPMNANRPFCLIDLQRMIRPTMRRRRWMVKDLAALNVSTPMELVTRTDRLRWFKMYLGTGAGNREARKMAWWIIGKALSMQRHEQRRQARFRAANETAASHVERPPCSPPLNGGQRERGLVR
ncbi:MAG: lipopolysaccharide kinase InaA family protein [Planctomycetota bacterium]